MKRHLLPSKEAVISGTLGSVSPNCAKRSSEHQRPARRSSKMSLRAKVFEKGSATLALWQWDFREVEMLTH